MRTTLTLDDDILELATRQAKLRGVSLGKTVSDLLHRGRGEENGVAYYGVAY